MILEKSHTGLIQSLLEYIPRTNTKRLLELELKI